MRRLASFPKVQGESGHPTLPVTHEGLISIDGLDSVEHFHRVMDKIAGQFWAFEYSPREARRAMSFGYLPAGIQIHVWAGQYDHQASVYQPTDGASQPLWRVKSWVPGLNEAPSLVGKTGTVITLDQEPSWPVFEIHGTESGYDWGPMTQCGEAAHGRGQWTVDAVEYKIIDSATAAFQLVPFALLLKAVEVEEVK